MLLSTCLMGNKSDRFCPIKINFLMIRNQADFLQVRISTLVDDEVGVVKTVVVVIVEKAAEIESLEVTLS